MKAKKNILVQLSIIILVMLLTSPAFSESQKKKETSLDNSIDIFGLKLNQSVADVRKLLVDSFKLRKEQIVEGRYYSPPIDGIKVDALTMSNIEIPVRFSPNSKPIKIKKLEVLFTLKLPITKPRITASKYIVFRFDINPELQTMIKQYIVDKLGPPAINNTEGYQWCSSLADDMRSCKNSCDINKPDELCPSDIFVGVGATDSNMAIAIVDYSMDGNARKAVNSLK